MIHCNYLFSMDNWYAMFAPAATPKPVVAKLNAEMVKMLGEREMSQRLAVQGADPSPSTPEQLGRYMLEEQNRWRKVIKSANLKLD